MDNELYDILDRLYNRYGETHWIINRAEHLDDGSWELNIQLKPIEKPEEDANENNK